MNSLAPNTLKQHIASLGRSLSPHVLQESQKIFASAHETETYRNVIVKRNLKYGDDERQALDLFIPTKPHSHPKALIIFVHGGGFIGGNRKVPELPYHDNIGLWAARNDMMAATISYRLAPTHPWPAGSEDVAAASLWLNAYLRASRGSNLPICLMGVSAGATHVAGCIAYLEHSIRDLVSCAILISGIYDETGAAHNPLHIAYFGQDPQLYPERFPQRGLLSTKIPFLLAVAEYDPPAFQTQANRLISACIEVEKIPPLIIANGHNHFSSTFHINTSDTYFSDQISRFIQAALER